MKLNALIDHTNLHQDATAEDIRVLCSEAVEHDFHSVAINSCWVTLASQELAGSDVVVDACIGFPLGACSTEAKVAETSQAIADGSGEIDMVLNVGHLKDGDLAYVEDEIGAVVEAAQGRVVKVILECCLLNREQIVAGCKASVRAGAAFVKTSTGFSKGGATIDDVRLMRETVGDACKVKAAGGIHTKAEAEAMVAAGADRIGTSSGIAIVSE